MISVARLVRDRRRTVARTLRETFGVGLSDLGDGLTWGEARLLLEEAASDPSTALGADLAGWAYPATTPMLISLSAQINDRSAAKRLMPWEMGSSGTKHGASDEELAAAQAELNAGIVFATT